MIGVLNFSISLQDTTHCEDVQPKAAGDFLPAAAMFHVCGPLLALIHRLVCVPWTKRCPSARHWPSTPRPSPR